MRPLHHTIDIEIDAATQANDSEYPEPKLTEILLDAGANINGEDSEGITPMEMAKWRSHEKAEKLFQFRGAA
jgi:ankyrin repeat protein